jgi:hypothetical protein
MVGRLVGEYKEFSNFDAPLSLREPRATHRHHPADVVRIKACYFSNVIKRLAAAARSGSAISGTGANGYS